MAELWKEYLSKIMHVGNSAILNLTKNKFLKKVQKIEFTNWDWFGIFHAA